VDSVTPLRNVRFCRASGRDVRPCRAARAAHSLRLWARSLRPASQAVSGDTALATALTTYQRASTAQQTKWASSYVR